MADIETEIYHCVEHIIKLASARKIGITAAESCTGGMIMAALTDIAGSSAVIDRGFITYSNKAKCQVLNVATATLRRHGAVSEPTVREMAIGALNRSPALMSVAVSGIAGPDGGSLEKPVGTVCFGFAWKKTIGEEADVKAQTVLLPGPSRQNVRRQTVLHALKELLNILTDW